MATEVAQKRLKRTAIDSGRDDAIEQLPSAINDLIRAGEGAMLTKAIRSVLMFLQRLGPGALTKGFVIKLQGVAGGDTALNIEADLELPPDWSDVYVDKHGRFCPAASLERVLSLVIRAPRNATLASLPGGFHPAPLPEPGCDPRGPYCTVGERLGVRGSSRTAAGTMVAKAVVLTSFELCHVMDADERLLRRIATSSGAQLRDHPFAIASLMRGALISDPEAAALARLTAAAPHGGGATAAGGGAAVGGAPPPAPRVVTVRDLDPAGLELFVTALVNLKAIVQADGGALEPSRVGGAIADSLALAREALAAAAEEEALPRGDGDVELYGADTEAAAAAAADAGGSGCEEEEEGGGGDGGGYGGGGGDGYGGYGGGSGGVKKAALKLAERRLALELDAARAQLDDERAAREQAQQRADRLEAALTAAQRECERLRAAARAGALAKQQIEEEYAALRAAHGGAARSGGGAGASGGRGGGGSSGGASGGRGGGASRYNQPMRAPGTSMLKRPLARPAG
ncbi:hypothetical protein Rsub_01158 [Raphidocelis subcapitata]|uniref:Uncharacterized protein n=1 Tax=Raphidocelis subcapitata TaxID=307507 RepID=A0A2V0NUE1_9CHLO|nr:hypothetical protein Rsub_01158 [Raphidocelis subcapitata]|eukprot:GBF88445.1 hypothetical protein Rsub_01158 [Raphidocelis subcapitata]